MSCERPTFNLLTEPWIPCVLLPSGDAAGTTRTIEQGIVDTLARAPEIVEITGETPLEPVAILRLLLAILHRCVPVATCGDWETLWTQGQLPRDRLTPYFDRWRGRFDLFDPARPFYQTPGLNGEKAGTAALLQHQADNNPTLFDHSVTKSPPTLSAAMAARLAVAIQSFDTCGIKTGDNGRDFAEAGPLVQAAVVQFRGRTLFHTLLLNLHRYSPDRDGEPWTFQADHDLPAWERSAAARPTVRHPDGYCDLLTWQSRRLWLEPTVEGDGPPVVRRTLIMKGEQFPKDFERRGRETMVSFRRRRDPTGTAPPWYPVRFEEDRAAWRDSLAFFTSLSDETERPKMARWLAELVAAGALAEDAVIPLDLCGLTTDRAKCVFWRHERLSLPAALLSQPVLVEQLRLALHTAERAAEIVSASWVTLLASDGRSRPQPTALAEVALGLVRNKKRVPGLVAQLGAGRVFWAALASPFQALLAQLPNDLSHDEFGNVVCADAGLAAWHSAIRQAARQAFDAILRNVGVGGTALAAAACGERVFLGQMRALIGDRLAATAEEGPHDVGNAVITS